ncbi:MAG: L-lactate dehydrogenase [Candidatus Babeliales bacterium]
MVHVSKYPSARVAIIGAGCVGSTTAYALMMSGTVSEIALIDVKKDKADGEALDLMHCMQFTTSVHIESGDDFALVKGAAVVVVAAGIPQKQGQPRSELVETNAKMFKEIIPNIVRHNTECIILVVTNPLDVLTYITLHLSGFPSCRVFGSGTVLDTARLRYLMGEHFNISPKDITAYILGEHGDSEFAWWSKATIAGVPISQLPAYDKDVMDKICFSAKNAVYEIIRRKGATFYAIALVVAKIVRAILLDQSRVFTVSTLVSGVYGVKDVCLSLPTVVRKSGSCERLPVELNAEEQKYFITSAQKIRQEIDSAINLVK